MADERRLVGGFDGLGLSALTLWSSEAGGRWARCCPLPLSGLKRRREAVHTRRIKAGYAAGSECAGILHKESGVFLCTFTSIYS